MVSVKSKVLSAVKRLELDLSGHTILTEAATGAYTVTSVIAALAGAEVYAYAKNTKHGSVEQVKEQTCRLLAEFDSVEGSLNIIDELSDKVLSKADVITNSGHLRPLNEGKLRHTKKNVVVSAMYEAWELRETDIDFLYCKKRAIRVGAINERHPDVDVFNYLGDMAIKMIFDAGLCAHNNYFLLICNNDFGPFIAKTLVNVCGSLGVCDTIENKQKYQGLRVDWIGEFPNFEIPEKYRKCEAILFTAYPFQKKWIGEGAPIPISKLKNAIEEPYILRFAGDVEEMSCLGRIKIYPEHVDSGHMGVLLSEIGFDPLIRLQSGGLKVAELMLKNELSYRNINLVSII